MSDYYSFGIYDGKRPVEWVGGNPKRATREEAIKLIAEAKANNWPVPRAGMKFAKKWMLAAHKDALFDTAEAFNKLAAMENP